jgi:hypothetical protein
MIGDRRQLARAYLLLLGAGLLLEGAALLFAGAVDLAMPFALDNRHNALHVLWGLFILGGLATSRESRRLADLALLFGVFYVGLALAGTVLVNPFGLLLGPGENLFHLTVGTGALVAAAVLQGRTRFAFVRPGGSSRGR